MLKVSKNITHVIFNVLNFNLFHRLSSNCDSLKID